MCMLGLLGAAPIEAASMISFGFMEFKIILQYSSTCSGTFFEGTNREGDSRPVLKARSYSSFHKLSDATNHEVLCLTVFALEHSKDSWNHRIFRAYVQANKHFHLSNRWSWNVGAMDKNDPQDTSNHRIEWVFICIKGLKPMLILRHPLRSFVLGVASATISGLIRNLSGLNSARLTIFTLPKHFPSCGFSEAMRRSRAFRFSGDHNRLPRQRNHRKSNRCS